MKSRWINRIFAIFMTAVLLAGDVLPAMAETVSGGDAPEQIEEAPDAVTDITDTNTGDTGREEPEEEATTDPVEPVEEPGGAESDNSVSDGDAENNATVSTGNAGEIMESEETSSEDSPIMMLEPVTVDGVTITVSGSREAFEEGTTVSATAVEPGETVIEAAGEKEQAAVKKYKAFDISLMLNGRPVQPLNGEEIKVNFEGSMLIPDNSEDVAVYHVAGEEQITRMTAEIAPLTVEDEVIAEQTVEMTTTHFSTYVIVITGEEGDCTVTYKHLLEGKPFYKPSQETVKQNEKKTCADLAEAKITAGGDDFTLTGIKVIFADGTEETVDLTNGETTEKEIRIHADAVIELNYEPAEKTQRYENSVIFYDYTVSTRTTQDIPVNGNTSYKIGNAEYKTASDGISGDSIKLEKVSGQGAGLLTIKKGEGIEEITIDGTPYKNAEYAYWGAFRVTGGSDGINGALTDENASRYLIMGRQADRPKNAGDLIIGGTYGGNANQFNGGAGNPAIVQGIAAGLTGDLKQVIWGKNSAGEQITEPGYFTMDPVEGKDIYEDDFRLTFDQKGNRYQLYSAASGRYGETFSKCQAAEEYDSNSYLPGDVSGQFFPLDKVPSAQVIPNSEGYPDHNWYFGMRYDFTFKLGDYIGDLFYTFEGDDDLWVFVDGELVLDLGGIHSTYSSRYTDKSVPNTVDLWQTYFGVADRSADNWWENANEKYDPDHEYQITVLYMERGAYASSCYMEFVLPNVESRIVTESYGSLSFTKTDSETSAPLAGAEFTLYNHAGTPVKTAVSEKNGVAAFTGLTAGDYTLKETKAPEGYEASGKEWQVQAVKDGDLVSVTLLDGDTVITEIQNTPAREKTVDLNFRKVEHGKLDHSLAGAEFTLTAEADPQFRMEAVSGPDGMFGFQDIKAGAYCLTETKAPEGYALPGEPWKIIVSESEGTGDPAYWAHGTVYDAEAGMQYKINGGGGPTGLWQANQNDGYMYIKNDPATEFTFKKIDSESKNPLSGVAFKLYNTLDAAMEGACAEALSDRTGTVTFTELSEGTYLLAESPNPGYCEAGPWVLEIKNRDGKYSETLYNAQLNTDKTAYEKGAEYKVLLEGERAIENTPERGALKITKTVDKVETVHGAASFTFKIEGPEGMVLYRTITFEGETGGEATKSVTVTGLPAGSYTVTELDALRYECITEKEQTKEVTAEETPEFAYKNKKVFENYYSHTDNVVNQVSFIRDGEGNITGSVITREKTSSDGAKQQ